MHLPDGFSDKLPAQLTWRHVDYIDSTNTALLDDSQPSNQLLSADRQTQGRGRRGQTWADIGDSALFSLSTAAPAGIDVSAWPIQVAMTLADSLNRLTYAALSTTHDHEQQPVRIKWPNDLYTIIQGQWGKCGGILIESSRSAGSVQPLSKIVTGVGLNLAPLGSIDLRSDYPIAHISPSVLALCHDKQQLIVVLANRLWQAWQAFIQHPEVDPSHYQTLDFLYGKPLIASSDYQDQQITGNGAGINANGHLLIQQPTATTALSSPHRIRISPSNSS